MFCCSVHLDGFKVFFLISISDSVLVYFQKISKRRKIGAGANQLQLLEMPFMFFFPGTQYHKIDYHLLIDLAKTKMCIDYKFLSGS